jgi:hypothetical protein
LATENASKDKEFQRERMKVLTQLVLATVALAGCGSVPKEPEKPDGSMRITINNPTVIAEVMSQYYRSVEAGKPKKEEKVRPKTTLGNVLEAHVPADFHVYVAPGVDLATAIDYDDSRPWTESIGKPLSDAGIDLTANLEKKLMELKLADTTIAQVVERFVPEDYKVFADDGVNLGAVVVYDRALPWTQALGKALSQADVGFTANLSKKVILLKSKQSAQAEPKKGEEKSKADAPGAKNIL